MECYLYMNWIPPFQSLAHLSPQFPYSLDLGITGNDAATAYSVSSIIWIWIWVITLEGDLRLWLIEDEGFGSVTGEYVNDTILKLHKISKYSFPL